LYQVLNKQVQVPVPVVQLPVQFLSTSTELILSTSHYATQSNRCSLSQI